MTDYRTEHDLLGERQVPAGALYGISTVRALENFPLSGRGVHPELIHAYGAVKLACARTNRELTIEKQEEHPGDGSTSSQSPIGNRQSAIERACAEMMEGLLDEHILVDALQGGAGTSTNMNVNEVLANRALQILGRPLGDYATISPTDDINLHQSTNDTYPTALKVAAIRLLRRLERAVVALLEAFPDQGEGVRPRGEGGADADAGRRAHHARPRDGGVRRGLRPRSLAGSTSARNGCGW